MEQFCKTCKIKKPLDEPFSPCIECGTWCCASCRVLALHGTVDGKDVKAWRCRACHKIGTPLAKKGT